MVDIRELKKTLRELISPEVINEGNLKEFVALPDQLSLHDLDEFLLLPRRIRRYMVVTDVDSFCRYWDKWGDATAEIFADVEQREIRAIFDEHMAETHDGIQRASEAPLEPVARWGSHTVTYQCPLSREWEAWEGKDKRPMDQLEFALFLEDRISEITDPAGIELQEIITNFKLQRDVQFDSAIRLQDGGVQLKYHELNEPQTEMVMPEEFELALPAFHNGTVYKLRARLRYRMSGGSLSLWYELIEPWRVLEHAFCAPASTDGGIDDEDGNRVMETISPLSVCAQISQHTSRVITMVDMESV